jgi:hypothetical protein
MVRQAGIGGPGRGLTVVDPSLCRVPRSSPVERGKGDRHQDRRPRLDQRSQRFAPEVRCQRRCTEHIADRDDDAGEQAETTRPGHGDGDADRDVHDAARLGDGLRQTDREAARRQDLDGGIVGDGKRDQTRGAAEHRQNSDEKRPEQLEPRERAWMSSPMIVTSTPSVTSAL